MFIFPCRACFFAHKEDVITPPCYGVKHSEQKAKNLFPLCPLAALLGSGCFEGKCRNHTGKVGLLSRVEAQHRMWLRGLLLQGYHLLCLIPRKRISKLRYRMDSLFRDTYTP